MIKSLAATFGGILMAQAAFAQMHAGWVNVREFELPNHLRVQESKLKNGLCVASVYDPSADLFSYNLVYATGSATEILDAHLARPGFAHLFEHLMFSGEKAYDQVTTQYGARDQNAETWNDRTQYYATLPVEGFEPVLKAEAHRAQKLRLNEKIFKNELGAVFSEMHKDQDNPYRFSNQELNKSTFTLSPYRFDTIGTESDLKRATLKDALYFYQHYYVPNNACFIVVGNLKPDFVFSKLDQYFGKLKPRTLPRLTKVTDSGFKPVQVTISHPQAGNPILKYGFFIPEITHPDIPAILLAQYLLSAGESAIFVKNIMRKQLAVSKSYDDDVFRYPSLLKGSFDLPENGDAEAVIKAMQATIESLSVKIDDADLLRAKNEFKLYYYKSLGDHANLAAFMMNGFSTTGDIQAYFKIADQIPALTASDVKHALKTYFSPSHFSSLLITPEKRP